MSNIEEIDNEILNEIQWTFPLVPRPFDAIAEKFNISSEAVSYTHLTLPTILHV